MRVLMGEVREALLLSSITMFQCFLCTTAVGFETARALLIVTGKACKAEKS